MEQREKFVRERMRGGRSMAELCRCFGISRQCGYKWLERVASGEGFEEQSRAPHRSPQAIPTEIEKLLIELKRELPHYGPKKLVLILKDRHPTIHVPAPSTAGEMLSRHGLVQSKRRFRKVRSASRPSPVSQPWAPNSVWCIDFKGQFRLRNGEYCFPLTTTDAFSRYLLVCRAFDGIFLDPTQSTLAAAFREYGLPDIIRSDNGTPFAATNSELRLSRLGVWLTQLGVELEHIEPGKPQQNGQHERMHRTLSDATTKPPERTRKLQQKKFDSFRDEFNNVRPHEGIAMKTPASRYKPSSRAFPEKLLKPEYPSWNEIRRVDSNGSVKWRGASLFVSHALTGHDIAFEPLDADNWAVRFFKRQLATLNERTLSLEAA